MQEYYKILGVSENATDSEIEFAYKTLRKKYSDERFLDGDAGNRAAKNLTKLETAYAEIKASRNRTSSSGSSSFSYVEHLIKEGEYNEAQRLLDDYPNRNAEWHYLQSVLFYKKNWINESKKQLEIAIELDPNNIKYRDSYEKLLTRINTNNNQYNQNGGAHVGGNYNANAGRQMGGSACSTFADCCTTWCCMELMCQACCR